MPNDDDEDDVIKKSEFQLLKRKTKTRPPKLGDSTIRIERVAIGFSDGSGEFPSSFSFLKNITPMDSTKFQRMCPKNHQADVYLVGDARIPRPVGLSNIEIKLFPPSYEEKVG